MNTVINNYCNINCEYCFANDVISEQRQNMTLDNFEKVIQFHKASNTRELRLIGGEPTLHPNFIQFMNRIVSDPFFESITVFTNGTFNDNVCSVLEMASCVKLTKIVVNYNNPSIIGQDMSNKVLNNIEKLSKTRVGITLGLNIYKQHQSYQYVIDAAKKYNVKYLRWSIVVPNTDEKEKVDVRQYYAEHSDVVKAFLNSCKDENIEAFVDCNGMPLCLMSDELLRLTAFASPSAVKPSVCSPVIDIKPDLSAIRCFIFNENPVPIDRFANKGELFDFFSKKDVEIKKIPLIDACTSCSSFKKHGSCGCLAFRRGGANNE